MPNKSPRKLSSLEIKLNAFVENHLTRVPFVQKMLFIHHLQIMTKAGLSIMNSLKILGEQIENKKLRRVIVNVKADVEKGQQLSEALAKFPKIFPSITVSMMAAGEESGKLEDALKNIYEQMHKTHELNSRIRGALIYPAVVFIAMGGIALEVVVVILPKLMTMFEEFNAELPLATRVLIWITNTTQAYGIWIAVGFVLLIMAIIYLIKKPKIKRIVHALNLKMPIFGMIIKKINLARFTLTLTSLLSSGIPIINAVRTTAEVQSNIMYRESLLEAAEKLKKGETLSSILANYPQNFPPMVTEMIMVGEETGQVEQMLKEMSEYYSAEVDDTMRNFSSIIEPVIILVLGLAVAGIALAVITPMYSLAQSV